MKGKAGRQKQSRKRHENGRKAAKGNRLPRTDGKAENGQKRTADGQAGNDQSGQAVTRSSRTAEQKPKAANVVTDGRTPETLTDENRNAHNGENRTQDGETHKSRHKKRIQGKL